MCDFFSSTNLYVIFVFWGIDLKVHISVGNLAKTSADKTFSAGGASSYRASSLLHMTFFPILFYFSSTSLLLPTHLPPPSWTHAQSGNSMGCSLPGSSVHGLFQARILEWVAISFSDFYSILTGKRCRKILEVKILWMTVLPTTLVNPTNDFSMEIDIEYTKYLLCVVME